MRAWIILLIAFIATQAYCIFARGQRYESFITAIPIPAGDTMILGFLGGRDAWDDPRSGVRRLALRLRSLHLPGVHVETVENQKRHLALGLVRNVLNTNRDGNLDQRETASARLILYGQSFGGAAVIKFAKQLQAENLSVLMTIQIDSVGKQDHVVPSNVYVAANLFQSNGLLIRGEPKIRAQDPARTRILGNFQFNYKNKKIDLSGVPWFKKIFRIAHAKMDRDPEVWSKVEELILAATQKPVEPTPEKRNAELILSSRDKQRDQPTDGK